MKTFLAADALMIVHHVLVGCLAAPLAVSVRKGHYFSGLLLLAEVSPIWLQFRWLLSSYGYKGHLAYTINGALLIASHFWFRLAAFPRAFAAYGHAIGVFPWYTAALKLPWSCQLGSVLLTLPQLYWFWLLVSGLINHVAGNALARDKTSKTR
jgi:hypothetical protein